MKYLIVVIAVLLTTMACGGPNSGTVYGKQYKDAYDTTMMVPQYMTQCSGSGPNFSCRQVLTGMLPVTTHHDACYAVYFRDGSDKGSACVDPQTYNALQVGDYFRKG